MENDEKNNKHLVILARDDYSFLLHRIPLAAAAREHGYKLTVITRDNGYIHKIRALGFNVCVLPQRRQSIFGFAAAILDVRKLVQFLKPDILYNSSFIMAILGSVASFNLPSVEIVNSFTGLGYLYTNQSIKARFMRSFVELLVRPFFRRRNVHALFQNKDDRSELENVGLVTRGSKIIRGSGVDIKRFSPLRYPLKRKQVVFGCAARLVQDKGIECLIFAFRSLRNEKHNIKLRVAGSIDEKNPASYRESDIEHWKLFVDVEILDFVDDMPKFWRGCDVAVLPSKREGMPKALLEAASCGKPLIASDVVGCRDLVEPGSNGLLFPVDNVEALKKAMKELSENVNFIRSAGSKSRDFILKSGFSEDDVKKEFIRFLDSIAQGKVQT